MPTILPALALLLASAAPTPEEEYSQCIDETITNTAWQACGETYLKRLDGDLNAAWVELDPQTRKALLPEQRAWLKFRDASCRYWQTGHGREGAVLHFYICRGKVIEDRIAALETLRRDLDPEA